MTDDMKRVRSISKANEITLAVRHAPPRTHGPNNPTLTPHNRSFKEGKKYPGRILQHVGMFSVLPRWHLCLAPTGVSRTRLFSVDCGRYANPVHDQIRDSFAIAWGGEVVKRLTQAQREANHHHTNFVEAMGNHAELTAQLEELKDIRAQEKKASEAVQEALRAQLVAEKRARASEEESLRTELEVALEGKTIVEAELKETRTRTAKEIEHLRAEVDNARTIGKEEFLKSPEFDRLLVKKSVAYFKSGFDGAVAQFRTNGFPEEEFPAPFLDMKKALREMPDGPVEEEKEEEEEVGETSGNESTAQDEDKSYASGQCGTGLLRSGGITTRGGASAKLGLVVEQVGLMYLRRRATRVASAELGFCAQKSYASGQCGTGLLRSGGVATRGGANAELGLIAKQVGLICLHRRAMRVKSYASGQCGTGLLRSGGVATRGGANAELGLIAKQVGLICLHRRAMRVVSAELGFCAQVGLPPEEVPMQNWA
ncbi:golgin subfamily B member 1-like [Dorcoceras hygrometricum]|uniref:Golgin subfamily B member 1-like n=1 Tax=Dorcoceras hygrometricum TaxID=472368 RepID=A0A2Z7B7E5_9LAMI|nr:golgin subfamily B member 1-like [Dorcoceras hygrometricum]